jgi:hypothetical protein
MADDEERERLRKLYDYRTASPSRAELIEITHTLTQLNLSIVEALVNLSLEDKAAFSVSVRQALTDMRAALDEFKKYSYGDDDV